VCKNEQVEAKSFRQSDIVCSTTIGLDPGPVVIVLVHVDWNKVFSKAELDNVVNVAAARPGYLTCGSRCQMQAVILRHFPGSCKQRRRGAEQGSRGHATGIHCETETSFQEQHGREHMQLGSKSRDVNERETKRSAVHQSMQTERPGPPSRHLRPEEQDGRKDAPTLRSSWKLLIADVSPFPQTTCRQSHNREQESRRLDGFEETRMSKLRRLAASMALIGWSGCQWIHANSLLIALPSAKGLRQRMLATVALGLGGFGLRYR
jgi:hypothetical protein